MNESPQIAIVVLNWNGWEDTVECVESLQQLNYPNYDVIVVDNGSADDSVRQLRNRFPDLSLVELQHNTGYAAGNNAGMRKALKEGAEYIWILNNDTVVDTDALDPLVSKMKSNPAYGLCGSKVVYYHEPDRVQILGGGSYNKYTGIPANFGQHQSATEKVDPHEIEKKLDFIIGAAVFVSRSFLRDVGMMEEDYFLYYEEIDWGIRAAGRYRLGFAPDSLVYHKEGASIDATNRDLANKSAMADYYMIKNRLRLTWKFYPWLLPCIYLTNMYSIINRMRRGQWSRIPMILKLFYTFNTNERYQGSKERMKAGTD